MEEEGLPDEEVQYPHTCNPQNISLLFLIPLCHFIDFSNHFLHFAESNAALTACSQGD